MEDNPIIFSGAVQVGSPVHESRQATFQNFSFAIISVDPDFSLDSAENIIVQHKRLAYSYCLRLTCLSDFRIS